MSSILAHYDLEHARFTKIEEGLINQTYLIETDEDRFILQRLNPIFSALIHEDIDAVTQHIEAKGLRTPRLIRTRTNTLWTEEEGEVWRMMSYVPGVTRSTLDAPEKAAAAGELLGRFHRALWDLDRKFENARLGVHDTPKHLANLENALSEQKHHPRYAAVAPLGEEILALAATLPKLPQTPDRIVHGDPKISNLIFSSDEREAIALVDLDTLARMPLPLELGDAFRSWCNPGGEEREAARFDLQLFEGGVSGYARAVKDTLSLQERNCIIYATETIIVELAARFCADALLECYFGWDPSRFESRGAHNELRARSQLNLARSLKKVEEEAQRIIDRAFHAFETQ